MRRDFQGECTLLAGAEMLGMLYFQKEEFQVHAEHVLIGKEKVKPVI